MITRTLAVFFAAFAALHLAGLVFLNVDPSWHVFKHDLSNRNLYFVAGCITLLLLAMDLVFARPMNKSQRSWGGRVSDRSTLECSMERSAAADSANVSQILGQSNALPDTETDPSWIAHAYPLQQIVVKVQGTRHSDPESMQKQLEKALLRLKAGELSGREHDDDFGYLFEVVRESPGPSFFEEESGRS